MPNPLKLIAHWSSLSGVNLTMKKASASTKSLLRLPKWLSGVSSPFTPMVNLFFGLFAHKDFLLLIHVITKCFTRIVLKVTEKNSNPNTREKTESFQIIKQVSSPCSAPRLIQMRCPHFFVWCTTSSPCIQNALQKAAEIWCVCMCVCVCGVCVCGEIKT